MLRLSPPAERKRPLAPFDKMCNIQGVHSHILARCYRLLISREEGQPLSLVYGWENDMGRKFTMEGHGKIRKLVLRTLMSR